VQHAAAPAVGRHGQPATRGRRSCACPGGFFPRFISWFRRMSWTGGGPDPQQAHTRLPAPPTCRRANPPPLACMGSETSSRGNTRPGQSQSMSDGVM
jgi:hypothetical protein